MSERRSTIPRERLLARTFAFDRLRDALWGEDYAPILSERMLTSPVAGRDPEGRYVAIAAGPNGNKLGVRVSSRERAEVASADLVSRGWIVEALYDLDDLGPEPDIAYGDIVKHDEQDYYVTSHDYEGIEGESVLMLQLSEDPEDLDGEMVEASEVELVDRSADYVDTRLPTRYDVASTRVVVAFNTIPTGATA